MKLLVIRLSALGDVVRTMPAVRVLKERHPSASITWVVEELSAPLLKGEPDIDEVVVLPRKRWSSMIRGPRGFWAALKEASFFVRDLRRRRFDGVLDFHGILKSGLIAFLSGASLRIGFDRTSSKEGNFLFSTRRIVPGGNRISRFERNLSLLRGLDEGIPPGSELLRSLRAQWRQKPFFHISAGDRERIGHFFDEMLTGTGHPLVAIHPGTSPKTPYKKWRPDRYALLSDRLVQRFGATVLFTWGPGEREEVEGIRSLTKSPCLLGPETRSLKELAELFSRCDLYIGGDTGPMHIASLAGLPVVVLYGPTDPLVNEPFGPHRQVRREVGCNPCRDRACLQRKCLDTVTVEEVETAAREMLAQAGPFGAAQSRGKITP
jgi:heptosyltransferase I